MPLQTIAPVFSIGQLHLNTDGKAPYWLVSSFYTPGRDGKRNAAQRPGSGGRPRGCGFEEQGGHVRVYRGGSIRIQRGLSPIAIFSLCVCVCPSYFKL